MELGFSFLLFLLFLSSATLIFCLKHHRSPHSGSPAIPKPYPIIGNLPHIIKILPRILDWSTEVLTATATATTATVVLSPFVFTTDPANVDHISKSRFDNYPKVSDFIASLHDFLGHGILNVNGDHWKLQRKTASYEFNTKSLRAFVLDQVCYEIENRLSPLLLSASSCCNGEAAANLVDLQEVLGRFAFDNICSLVFGYDPDCLYGRSEEGERFFRAFDEATQLSVERNMIPLWKVKKLLNIGSEKRLRESMEIVHGIIEGFIGSRKKELQLEEGDEKKKKKKKKEQGDFLSRFIEDGSYSDEFIRDVLISFLVAGRDTTPSALTWFFWLVSSRPHVVDKILEELKLVRARHNVEKFTLDELREMNYLHAAISESLRLYPPVPLMPRECKEDDELPDGTKVKKGWIVMYNEYAMARTEKIWGEECGEFKPERWLDEDGVFKPRSVCEYPVFHAGPRMCLGKEMAYIQMKAVAASILQGFELEVVERGRHHLGMTMTMEGGLLVRVKKRG